MKTLYSISASCCLLIFFNAAIALTTMSNNDELVSYYKIHVHEIEQLSACSTLNIGPLCPGPLCPVVINEQSKTELKKVEDSLREHLKPTKKCSIYRKHV